MCRRNVIEILQSLLGRGISRRAVKAGKAAVARAIRAWTTTGEGPRRQGWLTRLFDKTKEEARAFTIGTTKDESSQRQDLLIRSTSAQEGKGNSSGTVAASRAVVQKTMKSRHIFFRSLSKTSLCVHVHASNARNLKGRCAFMRFLSHTFVYVRVRV